MKCTTANPSGTTASVSVLEITPSGITSHTGCVARSASVSQMVPEQDQTWLPYTQLFSPCSSASSVQEKNCCVFLKERKNQSSLYVSIPQRLRKNKSRPTQSNAFLEKSNNALERRTRYRSNSLVTHTSRGRPQAKVYLQQPCFAQTLYDWQLPFC